MQNKSINISMLIFTCACGRADNATPCNCTCMHRSMCEPTDGRMMLPLRACVARMQGNPCGTIQKNMFGCSSREVAALPHQSSACPVAIIAIITIILFSNDTALSFLFRCGFLALLRHGFLALLRCSFISLL